MTFYDELLPLAPFGKARPRVTRNGTYMPKSYTRRIQNVRALCNFEPDPGKVYRVLVTGYRRIPKTGSNRNRKHREYCTAKPDVDNLVGAIMDALFIDDSMVVECFGCMRWGNREGMRVTIQEIDQ